MIARTRLSLGLAALTVAGCTLGPDPTLRPETPVAEEARFVHSGDTDALPDPDGGTLAPWWTDFADPATAALVEEALEANTDLAAAAARVAVAEAGLRSARSSLWPSADFGLSGSRSRSSFVLPQVGRVGVLSTTFVDQLSVSYQVDLFGRLARTRQAAWAELLAARDGRETVLHSVVAAVVRSRILIAGLEARLDLARGTLETWEETAGLIERRYRRGLADAVDLRLARQSRESARATMPLLEAALARARHALDVLLGHPPGIGHDLPALAELPPLEPPPAGLPVQLLDRRPDVRAAERRAQAATARVGISLANLFPSLSLTGSAGHRSDDLGDLLSSETLVYDAVAGLLTPIFSGGRLRADVAAARARVDEATADYAGAVLRALREVEDALVTDAAARRRHDALAAAVEEAREGARLALERYERGTGPLLTYLEAERRRFANETQRIEARESLWTGRVDLHLALGGDWVPTPAPAPSSTASTASPASPDPNESDAAPAASEVAR